WHAASMGVEQTIDQMQIARTARAGTDCQFAGHLRFACSRKRCNFLVTHVHPFDRATISQRFRETIQAVPHDPVDALDASFLQCPYKKIGHVADRHDPVPFSWPRRAIDRWIIDILEKEAPQLDLGVADTFAPVPMSAD